MKVSTLVYTLWALAAGLWLAVELAFGAGWRINHTESLPRGLWRVRPVNGPIVAGQIVNFCPPDTGSFRMALQRGYLGSGACPGGYEPLLKPVAAIAGDVIQITTGGIAVNGRAIANSAAVSTDRQGRAMPRLGLGTYVVGDGEIWLISDYNPASFDSRYFGPVPVRLVLGAAARR